MQSRLSAKTLASAAMFAALTFLATSVLKIPTPTLGYIHIGDAFVLLSGVLFGPLTGGLSAGLGSALADLLGGYVIWAPFTFVVKFLTAFTAALVFRFITSRTGGKHSDILPMILAGFAGETVMVIGYLLTNIVIVTATGGSFSSASLAAAAISSVAEIPFNLVQGLTGIIIGTTIQPIFRHLAPNVTATA
uniref:ECF transporter S component n=1 Tax=Eubacterium cellulosolvens TaxID=29322 RepID=UPI00048688DA|nr:ECF transporter S component [[Eubacterium] cellulosolvens]